MASSDQVQADCSVQAVRLSAKILAAVNQIADQASQSDSIGKGQTIDVSQEFADWFAAGDSPREPAEEPKSSQEGSLDGTAGDSSREAAEPEAAEPEEAQAADYVVQALQWHEAAQAAEPEAAEPEAAGLRSNVQVIWDAMPAQPEEAHDYVVQALQWHTGSGHEFWSPPPPTILIKY